LAAVTACRRLIIPVALAAAAATFATAASASAPPGGGPTPPPAPRPCRAPTAGYQACLRVRYTPAPPPDNSAQDVHVTAKLLHRVASCRRPVRRTVVLTTDGRHLASAKRGGTCRNGVVTWTVTFGPKQTDGWHLRQGDTIHESWRGLRATAQVHLFPRA
jgi:hypothetical protein